jgi:hypothetical protein
VYQQAASLSGNLNFNAVAKVCCTIFSQIYAGSPSIYSWFSRVWALLQMSLAHLPPVAGLSRKL